jgi:hypothetical protein
MKMVNRTNNVLECYNKRFNGLFDKQPTIIEFVQIVEGNTIPGTTIQDIRAGKHREVQCENGWVPDISLAYYHFKNSMSTPVEAISTPTKTSKGQKKSNKAKRVDKETVYRSPKLIDKETVHRSPMKEQNGHPNKCITKKPKKSFP